MRAIQPLIFGYQEYSHWENTIATTFFVVVVVSIAILLI